MALDFDGSSQYILCADNSSLDLTNGLTQTAWIYPTANVANGTITTKTNAYYFQRHNDGKLAAYQYGTTPAGYLYSTGTVPLNEWSFVAITYNGTKLIFYINGESSGEVNKAGNITNSSYGLYIGWDNYPSARYFDGIMFDARIYNRALTPNEIAEIYHKRGADRVLQGLVGQWRLDELSGGTPAPLLDTMDSTSGWSGIYEGSISLNTTTFKEGSGALNIYKTVTSGVKAYMQKIISAVNLTNKNVYVWIYIKNQATLDVIDKAQYWLESSSSNNYRYYFTSLSVGWNALGKSVTSYDYQQGSPNIASITKIVVGVATKNAANTLSQGDVVIDFLRTDGNINDTIATYLPDLSGNGNHGTPYYSPVYQASPHRLRRGVLVS